MRNSDCKCGSLWVVSFHKCTLPIFKQQDNERNNELFHLKHCVYFMIMLKMIFLLFCLSLADHTLLLLLLKHGRHKVLVGLYNLTCSGIRGLSQWTFAVDQQRVSATSAIGSLAWSWCFGSQNKKNWFFVGWCLQSSTETALVWKGLMKPLQSNPTVLHMPLLRMSKCSFFDGNWNTVNPMDITFLELTHFLFFDICLTTEDVPDLQYTLTSTLLLSDF